MTKETLDLKRSSRPAPDHDVEAAANDILAILRDFESPKDAASALTLAHFKMLVLSFPPQFIGDAIAAVDAEADLLKQFLREGWQ